MTTISKLTKANVSAAMGQTLRAYERLSDLSAQLDMALESEDHRAASDILAHMESIAENLGLARDKFKTAFAAHRDTFKR